MTTVETNEELDLSNPKSAETKEAPRTEVSAATIARMMGVATQTEMKLLEGKIDFLTTKINSFTTKLDRLQTALNSAPTSTDLDRIDINIGGLKTMLRDFLTSLPSSGVSSSEAAESAEQGRKLRAGIKSNNTKPAVPNEAGEGQ